VLKDLAKLETPRDERSKKVKLSPKKDVKKQKHMALPAKKGKKAKKGNRRKNRLCQ
jgi:hypothetical protein